MVWSCIIVGDMKRRGSPAIKYGSSDSVTETGAQQGKSSSTVTIRRTEGNGQEKTSGRASAENVGKIERRSPPSFNGSSNSVDETGARRGKSSSTVTIRQTEGNSQEKSSGRASVEVENRDSNNKNRNTDNENRNTDNENRDSDNKKRGRKKLSELDGGKRRRRTVGNTKRDIMELFSTDRANRTDVERVLNRNIGEMMAQGEIRGDALDTLVNELLQTGSVVSSSKNSSWIDETYENIRSDLKGGKLYLMPATR